MNEKWPRRSAQAPMTAQPRQSLSLRRRQAATTTCRFRLPRASAPRHSAGRPVASQPAESTYWREQRALEESPKI